MKIVCALIVLLLVPSVANAQETKPDYFMRAGYVTLSAVSFSDIETTGRALERPGMSESNWFLKPFADTPGMVGLVNGGLSAGVGLAAYRIHKSGRESGNPRKVRFARALIWTWTIARGVVVIHNVRELRKNKAE
jgi:hypothetical protein